MKRFFLVLALALAAYSGSFHAGFHFDDFHQLVNNQHMRSLANVPRFFTEPRLASFSSEDKGYRPVTYTTFALNYALAGYRVFWYHAVNFCLHVLCAFLVFVIVRAVLRDAGSGRAGEYALLVAALFAVHPVQTGAVTYITGRAALLASLFYLSGLACFLRFRGRGGYLWGAAAPALVFV